SSLISAMASSCAFRMIEDAEWRGDESSLRSNGIPASPSEWLKFLQAFETMRDTPENANSAQGGMAFSSRCAEEDSVPALASPAVRLGINLVPRGRNVFVAASLRTSNPRVSQVVGSLSPHYKISSKARIFCLCAQRRIRTSVARRRLIYSQVRLTTPSSAHAVNYKILYYPCQKIKRARNLWVPGAS